MPSIFEAARFKLDGFDFKTDGVSIDSPLVEQSRAVYKAARHIAQRDNWVAFTMHGRSGRKGPLNQKQLAMTLLVGPLTAVNDSEDAHVKSVLADINATLKACNAMRCTYRGDFTCSPAKSPIWWVADEVEITTGMQVRGNRVPFSENGYLNQQEKNVTADEAGENLEPSPVVTSTVPKSKTIKPLSDSEVRGLSRTARYEYFAAVRDMVLEEVSTANQAMSPRDLQTVMLSTHGFAVSVSSLRTWLTEWSDQGKLVSRPEDPSERHLRAYEGDAEAPRARGPVLYGSPDASGKLPLRTALPRGVEQPRLVSPNEIESVMKLVLEFFESRGSETLITSSELAVFFKVHDGWLRSHVLMPLVRDGNLAEPHRGVFRFVRKPAVAPTQLEWKNPDSVVYVAPQAQPELVDEMLALIDRYRPAAPAVDTERMAELEKKVLEQEKTITKLKAAIAALT